MLLQEDLVSFLLSKVEEMSFFPAFDDVLAEKSMLEDALLKEVELASLE